MSKTTTIQNFPSIDITNLFIHCDDLCLGHQPDTPNNLLYYFASSNNPDFEFDICYEDLCNRVHDPDINSYGVYDYEYRFFERRSKILNSNNRAYELTVKINPTVEDLENFSKIDPCFALLYPVKKYLMDHLDLAVKYQGMLPFGKEVVRCFNSIVPVNQNIKGNPNFKEHLMLKDLSNRKALLMGVPSVVINNLMYSIGKNMKNQDTTDSEE